MLHNKRVIGTIGIMAGLPSYCEEFGWSLARLVNFTNQYVCGPNERIELIKTAHSFHSFARNQLVENMQGDWLLQLDTDHSFDPDLLARLLNLMHRYDSPSYRVGIVGGLYLHKHPPFNPTMWQWTGVEDRSVPIMNWPENETLEVGVLGTGCLLTKRWVFDRIRTELKQDPFSTSEFAGLVGEDFAFARRCKQLGLRMVINPKIECHHLGISRLTVDKDYPASQRLGSDLAHAV